MSLNDRLQLLAPADCVKHSALLPSALCTCMAVQLFQSDALDANVAEVPALLSAEGDHTKTRAQNEIGKGANCKVDAPPCLYRPPSLIVLGEN